MAVAGLIVGLGNPGKQYESTRHNMGFLFVDELLREAKNVSSMSGDKFRCELWKAALPGSPDQWLIAKPQTFMNLSGECVQPLAAWHRLLPENILVVHDELDIAPGRMKFKKGGGNAGHNGLKSITQRLGTPDFYRLRLGIGRSPHGGEDTVNWVLGRLSPEAQDAFRKQLPAALEVVRLFAEGNIPAATHAANAFVIAVKSEGKEKLSEESFSFPPPNFPPSSSKTFVSGADLGCGFFDSLYVGVGFPAIPSWKRSSFYNILFFIINILK